MSNKPKSYFKFKVGDRVKLISGIICDDVKIKRGTEFKITEFPKVDYSPLKSYKRCAFGLTDDNLFVKTTIDNIKKIKAKRKTKAINRKIRYEDIAYKLKRADGTYVNYLLTELSECKLYKIKYKILKEGIKSLTREEKNYIYEELSKSISSPSGCVNLYGYCFSFKDYLKTYWVKIKDVGIAETYAFDKTSIRAYFSGIIKIVEIK